MLKTIFQGKLCFESQASFEKLKRMFEHRAETLYKGEILFATEDIFKEEILCLEIPRTVNSTTDKFWQKTVQLVNYAAQFAVAGRITAWVVENGFAKQKISIRPSGDKSVIKHYQHGVELSKSGKYEEAILAFDSSLSEFSANADALSRKAFCLKNIEAFDEAEAFYNQSIEMDAYHPEASFGLAIMLHDLNRLEEALNYYEKTIPRALAVQGIYWEARREKARVLQDLSKGDLAMAEYRLLTKKQFPSEDPNFEKRGEDAIAYTKLLLEKEESEQACDVLDGILEGNLQGLSDNNLAELYYLRSQSRLLSNKKGHKQDLETAEKFGFIEKL
jgi:tetratricopeptide (TPR) repeat protein